MKTILLTLLSGVLMLGFYSCTRKDGGTAGKGGKASISCILAHHGVYKNIINGKVYIKYNAQDLPDRYDDSLNCDFNNGKPTATFNELRSGNYYLYGRGTDTTIGSTVEGGRAFTIDAESAQSVTLNVTEGD